MDAMELSLPFANTVELDLINFAGSFSFEIVKCAHWAELLDRAKYPGLVILLGAGGVVLYFARYGQKQITARMRDQGDMKHRVINWIFEDDEDNEEFGHSSVFNLLQGYSLGLLRPLVNKSLFEGQSSDIGLNSITANSISPRKFLKQPLYRKDESERSTLPGDCSMRQPCHYLDKGQTSKHLRDKRSLYKLRLKRPEDKLIIQRPVASNRLSFKYFQPGCDLRMDGDGCEQPDQNDEADFLKNYEISKHQSHKSLKSYKCSDPACTSTHCPEDESEADLNYDSDRGEAMLLFMQNAEEVRRLIRETSFDSTVSDFNSAQYSSFGNGDFINCRALSRKETPKLRIYTDHDTNKKLQSYEHLWETDVGADSVISCDISEVGDDDSWEWDDECDFGEDTVAKLDEMLEHNTDHQSWLPDDCRELDMESELTAKDEFNLSTRSSRSSSTRSSMRKAIRRFPPSGSSSLERKPDPS